MCIVYLYKIMIKLIPWISVTVNGKCKISHNNTQNSFSKIRSLLVDTQLNKINNIFWTTMVDDYLLLIRIY